MRWPSSPIQYHATVRYGLGKPPTLVDHGRIAIIRATNIERGRITTGSMQRTNLEHLPLDRAPLLQPDEVLVVRSGAYTGDSALVGNDWAGSAPGYDLRLTPDAGTDGRFLAWAMLSSPLRDQVELAKTRAAQPHLNADELASFRIPSPPLEVQRRIADFLDTETARIDTLLATNHHAAALVEERIPAASNAAFTGGGSQRGWTVPSDWPLRPLSSLSRTLFADGDWIESPYITSDGIRLIQTGNIGVGHYREQGYRYIAPESFSKLRCTEVMPGDVLICRLADPIGRACLAPEMGTRMVTSVDVTILRCDLDAKPDFAVEALSSPSWLAQMQSEGQGGTRSRIARLRLGEMRIPVPPAPIQSSIVRAMAAVREDAHRALAALKRQRDLLAERRQALITAAVTGELEV